MILWRGRCNGMQGLCCVSLQNKGSIGSNSDELNRCSTIQKSELGVKIHVQWKRSREAKQCPFYFEKERVFLLVCVERCLRDAGERWPGDGEKVWCCWLGERIKIGCLGLGWGMDFRGKDVDEEKSGRWDNEKNWEGVEDELRPLLLE